MSRRARTSELAREAKHAAFYAGPEEDTDDEGGIDAEPCPHCDGDGMDPMNDYALACPLCCGEEK